MAILILNHIRNTTAKEVIAEENYYYYRILRKEYKKYS